MSVAKRIFERCFAVLLLAEHRLSLKSGRETSSPGRAGDCPTEESLDFKRPGEGRSLLSKVVASHCRHQSTFMNVFLAPSGNTE